MSRVLIADDDVTSRKMLGMMIVALGHTPIFSPDGQHALESLQSDESIELLITDVMMPRLDGRGLIRKLRATQEHRCLPVIVVSSVVGPKDIADLLKLGASRFQPKPIDLRELTENIEAVMGGRGAEQD